MENKLETVSSAVDTAVAVNERGGVGMFVKGEPVEGKKRARGGRGGRGRGSVSLGWEDAAGGARS